MNPLDLLALTALEMETYAVSCSADNYGLALDWMGGLWGALRAVRAAYPI